MAGTSSRRWGGLALALALAGPGPPARAHPLAPSLLEVREGPGGSAEVRWRTPLLRIAGADLRPLVPAACPALGPPRESRADGSLERRWRIACPPPGLVGRRLSVSGVSESRADVVLRVELADGRRLLRVLRGADPAFVVPARAGRRGVLEDYLGLGARHIAGGVDHLLFVLALLLLVPARRTLLWTVTAFTAGHSATLALAVLGWLDVPRAPVEAAIAASILLLAAELAGERPGRLRRAPWLVAGAFGLLHGLGFAGALAKVGLPHGEIPLALFAFNAGIELGQLAFIAAVLAARDVGRRLLPAPGPLAGRIPAYAIGGLAAFWLLERLAAAF